MSSLMLLLARLKPFPGFFDCCKNVFCGRLRLDPWNIKWRFSIFLANYGKHFSASPFDDNLFSSCDIEDISKALSRFRICIYFHDILLQNCNSYFPCNSLHADIKRKQRTFEIVSTFQKVGIICVYVKFYGDA